MAACPADPLHHQPVPYKYHHHPAQPSRPSLPLHLAERSPRLSLPPTAKAPSASQTRSSQMAVLSLGCGIDKENAPPPSAARGIAVKRHTMKKPGAGSKAPRRRPPLRDITWLFVNAAPCPPPSTAVLLALSDAALPEDVPVRPDGVTVKQRSHSLRMGFR